MRDNFKKGTFLGVSLCIGFLLSGIAGTVFGYNIYDNNFWDNYTFQDGDFAVGRVFISDTATLASGGNVNVGLYGGQFHNLDMNDGTLTLTRDLVLTGNIVFDSSTSGTITTNTSGLKTIFMSVNQTLSNHLTFMGDTALDSDNQIVDLDDVGTFSIDNGKTLLLRNMVLEGLGDNWLWINSLDQNTTISFDNVVFQSNPYSAYVDQEHDSKNIMYFRNDCLFADGFKLSSDIELGTKFPISGALDLNGYTLTMVSDLEFVDMDGFKSEDDLGNPGGIATDGVEQRTLFFHEDQYFTDDILVYDSIIVDCGGSIWDLNGDSSPYGRFTLMDPSVTITFRNIIVKDWGDHYSNLPDNIYFENITGYSSGDVYIVGEGDFMKSDAIFTDTLVPFRKKVNIHDGQGYTIYLETGGGDLGIYGGHFTFNPNPYGGTEQSFTNSAVFKSVILDSNDFDRANLDTWLLGDSVGTPTQTYAMNVLFDQVTFNFDPYSSDFLASNHTFSFKGEDFVFNAGFKLPSDIELGTQHPFSGELNLNGYTLTLRSDLHFDDDGMLGVHSPAGREGEDAFATIPERDDKLTIFFDSNQSFTNQLKIKNSMTIEGNNNVLDLGDTGSFYIEAGKKITFKNITIKNLMSVWITGPGDYEWGPGVVLVP